MGCGRCGNENRRARRREWQGRRAELRFGAERRRRSSAERQRAVRLRHVLRSARLAAIADLGLSLVLSERSDKPVVRPKPQRSKLSNTLSAATARKVRRRAAAREVRDCAQHARRTNAAARLPTPHSLKLTSRNDASLDFELDFFECTLRRHDVMI